MSARHPGHLSGTIEGRDRLKILIEYPALQIGLDAAEVLARQGKKLHRVIWRCVKPLRLIERFAKFRLLLQAAFAGSVVALYCGEKGREVDLYFASKFFE